VNRRRFLLSSSLGGASLAAAAPYLKASPQVSGSVEPGFTPLFDGVSLTGWNIREGPESAFYVRDGAIVVHDGSSFPTWLASSRQYENFDFRCEFFLQGWIDSGIFLHAPEHGRSTWTGFNVKISHKTDPKPTLESLGAVFPIAPPSRVGVVKNRGEWNSMRIVMDWPRLQVWVNDTQVQDLDVESVPELRYRLRRGYLGLESLSYPVRFRNLRIRELPAKENWTTLYESPADMDKWFIAEGKPKYDALGEVLRGEGIGYLATREKYRDFEFHMYVRASKWSNGGIIFRPAAETPGPSTEHYEIQIHDVEDAFYPTGSLYGFERAMYPKIEPEKWFLFQLRVKDRDCLVRINGETVMQHHALERLNAGHIMLQAHDARKWIEYKHIRIKAV
jgi:hypothetical protein